MGSFATEKHQVALFQQYQTPNKVHCHENYISNFYFVKSLHLNEFQEVKTNDSILSERRSGKTSQ